MKWLWLSILVILVDQLTKYFVNSSLQLYESVELINGFKLTLRYNTGVAFSFLSDAGSWTRWLFVALSTVISIMIIIWIYMTPPHRKWVCCSLGLILGGAVGNLLDRAIFGYVIDFIDVSLTFIPLRLFNPWPVFNLADSALTVGVVMMIIDTFWFDKAFVSTHSGKSAKS